MSANSKTIKRRIKSVANTKKITKAMELVAASKMRRAVNSVIATRPFAQLSWNTVNAVTKAIEGGATHPLLKENDQAEKTLIVLFTSDRGLAGAYNANIIKHVIRSIKAELIFDPNTKFEAVSVGKKGNAILSREKIPVIASFEGLTNKPKYEDILPIGNLILKEFKEGKYKKVIIAYTDFISALAQQPQVMTLLPLQKEKVDDGLGDAKKREDDVEIVEANEYLFEPSPQEVLNRVLPRLVETMVYQALLESAASEHSARMMAMRSASDAATDMLKDLKFSYNQIRQAGITQEIAEISSGAAAIK